MNVRTKASAVYDAISSLLGDHSPERVRQTLELELSRLLPVWTEDRPTCPGWYWYKAPGISEPRLILVDYGRIDSKLMADLGPPNNLVDVNRINGRWAGPIEPPG